MVTSVIPSRESRSPDNGRPVRMPSTPRVSCATAPDGVPSEPTGDEDWCHAQTVEPFLTSYP